MGRFYKGQSYRKAFETFQASVILPLLASINLPKSRFFFTPGNHDIVRDADSLRDELGSKAYFKNETNISTFINDAIKNNSYDGIKRIEAYKKFEYEFYETNSQKRLSVFESSFIEKIDGLQVGIACLNSSWRCYGDDDLNNILLGERQLSLSYNFIKNCDLKIALVHHPLDWLSVVERKIITSHITKDFDIVLSGHVHESLTSMTTGFVGNLFVNICASGLNDIRSDSRQNSNGFTVIDIDNGSYRCKYWRYNHERKEFVINTDTANDGESIFTPPSPQSTKLQSIVENALSNIREDHFDKMDEHFIAVKAEIAKPSIKECFIFPPIDQGLADKTDDSKRKELSLHEITKMTNHIMFFGLQESGKTSLLFRLVREYVDDYSIHQRIPVYIPFEEIGNKEIATVIKEYLRCSTDQVKELLKSNQIILLIDNLNYKSSLNNQDRINKVHRFNSEYGGIRIITAADYDTPELLPSDYLRNCKINFETYFIHGLKTREIKSIMKQWLPEENEIKTEERLEKLVTTFRSYSLPNTAMSVSLYLWSLENKERKPINQAVLMEIYVEIVLEKLNKENIYRGTFDFVNKMQLIAKIAQEMLILGRVNYSLTHTEFNKVIEEYLEKLVGFSYDPQIIIDYLFKKRLFVKTNDNHIKFQYNCFFHFFIAKRMEYDESFKEYILDEDKYFLFPKQLDYYTGLTRSDIKTFKIIFERFEEHFRPIEFILNEVNIDDYFTLRTDVAKQEPIARNLEIAKIKESRPTESDTEEIYDEELRKLSDPSAIPAGKIELTHDRLLLIMCNVLRNSEGIEDLNLKRKAFRSIIKNNLAFSILYTQAIIKYVLDFKELPPSIPRQITLQEILTNLPYHMEHSLMKHLLTNKLSPVILEKIKEDQNGKSITKSEIEAYMSVTLYSDVQGQGFETFLMSFIKKTKSTSVQNYLLFKLTDYYYRRTKPGTDQEKMYLNLLTELRIRTQKLPKRLREKVMKTISDQKNKMISTFKEY